MFAAETAEVFLALLIITHPELAGPLRFVNNVEDILSRVAGEDDPQPYYGCPFELTLPDEREDQLPSVRLTIDNVDQAIVANLRAIATAPTLTLYVVLASSPDLAEVGPIEYALRSADYSAASVTGTLAFADVLSEPFPWRLFTPTDWPGVFA
jgi:Domain of unknown function (DUF1833)